MDDYQKQRADNRQVRLCHLGFFESNTAGRGHNDRALLRTYAEHLEDPISDRLIAVPDNVHSRRLDLVNLLGLLDFHEVLVPRHDGRLDSEPVPTAERRLARITQHCELNAQL